MSTNLTIKKLLIYYLIVSNKKVYYNLKSKKTQSNLKKISKYLYNYISYLNSDNDKQHLLSKNIYLVEAFSKVNTKFDKYLQVYLNYRNNYFYWYFFNQDALINIFVNLLMKKGNKYVSYKHIYKSMFFIKQLTGLQPLTFFKHFLSKHRLLFDIKSLVLRKRVLVFPKLLSVKIQITKSLKYILNNFKLSSWYSGKKNKPLYQKIGYLLLSSVFNVSTLRKIIKKDKKLLCKHFGHIRKEEYFNKYVLNVKSKNRRRMFKIKYKSKTKKMKLLEEKVKITKQFKYFIDTNKKFLLNRYNMHIQCKRKIRTKWFG